MSDNEYERFEISDYDIANEFNINRPRRRQTKHQQIYGIWADDSDNDSGNEMVGRRRRGLTNTKPKDYTAPVNFVAGGIQQAGKKKKGDKNLDDDDKDMNEMSDIDDEDEARPSFGHKQPEIMDIKASGSSDDSSTEEKPQRVIPKKHIGFGSKASISKDKNVGAWEQHTRGIGAKLLLQMGYQPGKGLGKDLQGISQPVEAHVRKGRGAIGAYGPEKPAKVAGDQVKQIEDDDVREAKDFKEKMNKWKKSTSGLDKTKRYYYKSVEEVIEKSKKTGSGSSNKLSHKLSNVPVIDMTGPERRVLSGYHALGQTRVADEELYETEEIAKTKKKDGENFNLPELMHNLNLIVDMCEQDIIALDKAERYAADNQLTLEQELSNLEEIVKLERDHINTLESAMILVEELSETNKNLTLQRAEQIFLELQSNHESEYKEFGLDDLAAGVIAPLLKTYLESWSPLQEPTKNVDLVKKWRTILETNDKVTLNTEERNVFNPYSSLIWAGVVPSFRACASTWNPKSQYQLMAGLLDCWAPLFPSWILDNVLEQLILPTLCTYVKEWDPLTDTIPIHIWILPWKVILGHKMEEFLFPTIRDKLGNALQAWMPQDRSARAMLTPWKGSFDQAEMQIFLMKYIIPKLQITLSELIINPIQQDLELWNQVWEWNELIPSLLMGELLDKHFFPKWMQVLVLWLNQSPDYTEISRWYSGWKNMISEAVQREPNIKEHFRRALEMMHRATDTIIGINQIPNTIGSHTGTGISPTTTTIPPPPQPPQISLIDIQQHMNLMPQIQLEFKELVSQKCAELGILFAPLPGRREQGKQIYRVGKLYCYIDRNVCMLSDSSFTNWSPASVAQLLERSISGII